MKESAKRAGFSVTLKDVALKVGYSVNTVSHALNNKPDISEETRAYIFEAAKEMGYIRNSLASGLRSGFTKTVAVIVGDVANPIFSILVKHMEMLFREKGYNIFIMNTNEQPTALENAVQSAIGYNVDGMIICPTLDNLDLIERLENSKIPFVLFGRSFNNKKFNSVVWDDFNGAYIATKYLLGLGHKKILYISGPMNVSSSVERLNGYKQAMLDSSVSLDNNYIKSVSLSSKKLKKDIDNILRLGMDYSAIFTYNDIVAYEFIDRLPSFGKHVPQHVSVVGFDGLQDLVGFQKTLTTINVPKLKMAQASVELLLKTIEDISYRKQIVLPVSLLQSETVKKYE